jgi:REP element-mobilizing transposase RayT
VWARGKDRRLIYWDDEDCSLYLRLLGGVVQWTRWRCFAYCLMDNHVHLLVQTPDPNLGDGMRRLHGEYAQRYNQRHGKVGHVFQGRFGSKLIVDDEQLWTVVRYIARNPVEAGLCREPYEWRWSSHRSTLDGSEPTWLDRMRLLERFGAMGGDPRATYRALVDA